MNNNFAKANFSEESLLDFTKQYISYDIVWQDTSLSQAAGGRSNITHSEQIWVEIGYQDRIENLLNSLAVVANVPTVSPTAN